MKFWFITTEFPPFHGGGISTYNHHTGLMLVEKGHDVTIFVPDSDIVEDEKRSIHEGIHVIRFKPGIKEYYSYLGYSSALSMQFSDIVLREIEKKGRPDFIETQDYHAIGYYLILNKKLGDKRLQNIPIILTAHAPSFFYLDINQSPLFSLPDYWTGEMEKWVMQAADILLTPSQYLIDNVKQYLNGYDQKFHIVRNPYKDLSNQNNSSVPPVEDIIFFGKLTYQKGCLQLLKYMSRLWDDGCEKSISFIGDDHYFEPKQMSMRDHLILKYKKYFKRGLFRFEGKLNSKQLDVRLEKASLIIVPSIVDNFPYAVVECMQKGKILLVSDGGGQREMVEDGQSGFVYEESSFESFSLKFQKATSLSLQEVKSISNNAVERISLLCKYDAVYNEKINLLTSYSQQKEPIFPFINIIPKSDYTLKPSVEKGKLSIVIPYYNTGKYIRETIESIEGVHYKNKETIVINDGSDDAESISVLAELQKKYSFKVITQRNAGLAEARNTGIRNASGEFVAFLDADDKIDPDFYGRSIDILNSYDNLSFVSSWVQYFDSSDGIWPAQNPEPPFLLLHNMVNAGFLCKKVDYLNFAINDSGFEYGMEDYDANLSLLENGCRGVIIPEPLYHYRIHASSMARGFNKFNRLYLHRLMSRKHKGLYEKFGYETFNLLMANGPSYLYDNPTLIPNTDVNEYRNKVDRLEGAIRWYDDKVKFYEQKLAELGFDEIDKSSDKAQSISFDQFSNSESSYEQLKFWYHKEYEVLPLWYKRIGHLIKVFKGHRTLKSLRK